jgi:hypothetical protein
MQIGDHSTQSNRFIRVASGRELSARGHLGQQSLDFIAKGFEDGSRQARYGGSVISRTMSTSHSRWTSTRAL